MTSTRTELAHRANDEIDVTLTWERNGDAHDVLVCVCDQRYGGYFEIEAQPYLALDVFYHPYFYRDFSRSTTRTGRAQPRSQRPDAQHAHV